MKILSGVFNLDDGKIGFENSEIYEYNNQNIKIFIVGEIRTQNSAIVNDGIQLIDLFEKHKENITEYICGLYIMIIYDMKAKALYCFQDFTSSPLTLFYCIKDNNFFFSTSLKYLLLESKLKREFNIDVFNDFIINGFIYGRETLLKNIFKITLLHYLKIDGSRVEEKRASYIFPIYSESVALKQWDNILEKSLKNIFKKTFKDELHMPLTSGFDSNYILYLLKKNTTKKVNTYTVGGKIGKNEIPTVLDISKNYKNIKNFIDYTDFNSINFYPDIVWRLEGLVFEVGIFLQYHLAKSMSSNNCKISICSDCADQILHEGYYQSLLDSPNIMNSNIKNKFVKKDPFLASSMFIIKKSGVLSNSFNIQTEYPFLEDNVVAAAKALRRLNRQDKKFHRENCVKKLSKHISNLLSKVPGTTDAHSFLSEDMKNKLSSFVLESEMYKLYEISTKGVKLFFRDGDQYFREEGQLIRLLAFTYLILFEKLFISHEYDDVFKNTSINIALTDLLFK